MVGENILHLIPSLHFLKEKLFPEPLMKLPNVFFGLNLLSDNFDILTKD